MIYHVRVMPTRYVEELALLADNNPDSSRRPRRGTQKAHGIHQAFAEEEAGSHQWG